VSNRKKTPSIPEVPPTPLISVAERRWLSLAESAAYLSFSANRIRKFIHDGELPATRVGALALFH
jgi:excisionase family DNA binding protein